MRRIISMLLQNEAGALARVASLFAARGYNIDSLTLAPTHDAEVSRLTMVTTGDDLVIDQIIKQSRKLVDVIEIADLTSREHLECELLIVKVGVLSSKVPAVAACVRRHAGALLLDKSEGTRTIQFAGTGARVNDFLAQLTSLASIIEIARSGTAALDLEAILTAAA
jgi:acetolactate synthase-1/3 small subunit